MVGVTHDVDPNILIPALLVAIPATIGAVTGWVNHRGTRRVEKEVTSPNGTSSAQTLQDIKATLNQHVIDDIQIQSEIKRGVALTSQLSLANSERITQLEEKQ